MKRGNGEGSITKLKGNRRRPYLVRGPAEYDLETGREKRLILGSYRTRAEAERSLMDYSRSPSKLYNISLGELWQMYINQQRTLDLSKSRQSGYGSAWQYWQALQDRKARDLRAIDFQAIVDKMQQDDLSAPTINSYVVVIRSALDYAVNNDILYKNYVYTSPDGKPYTYARLRRAFDALCKRLDLDGLSLKATRHTYANKLRKSGADAEVMRALMGHTKYEQSLDYTQADEAEKRAAAD